MQIGCPAIRTLAMSTFLEHRAMIAVCYQCFHRKKRIDFAEVCKEQRPGLQVFAAARHDWSPDAKGGVSLPLTQYRFARFIEIGPMLTDMARRTIQRRSRRPSLASHWGLDTR